MKKVFLSLMALAALCSCAKDETPVDGAKPWTGGDEAYINIRIASADAMTKAGEEGEDASAVENPFKYGDEHEVKSARFFFYDGAGVFVSEANVWNGGKPNENKPDQNIEYFGNSVVVLRGLTEKTFPKYVVTVLNTPDGFTPGETLSAMETKLAGKIYKEDTDNNITTRYFAMSTTSYKSDLPYYFVNEVEMKNFANEPVAAEIADPVVVYVERLAAKVTLNVSSDLKSENGLYKLNVTLSGNDNDEGEKEEDNNIGATNIYLKFTGWGLNATAKDSYMMKNIDTGWADDKFSSFNWNDAGNFRSYWGKSYLYNDANYGEKLTYKNVEDLTKNQIGDSDYCAENTTTAAYAANRDAVTSVVLVAEICDKDGKALEDYVRYNGVLYTKASYLNYALNSVELNLYTKSQNEEGETVYTKVDNKYAVLAELGSDGVYAQIEVPEGAEGLYALNAGTTDDYQPTTDFSEANNALKAFNVSKNSDGVETSNANGYKGGQMYYNIPIQHLERPATDPVGEANYGVVRNHLYSITVNSLTKLGKGIYNPEEVIIPNKDDEKEAYYVGAEINILSWKIVSQGVDL